MLTEEDLLTQDTVLQWSDIDLKLYKDFTVKYLLTRTFRYYLINGMVITVCFKEWAMRHLWAIHHINNKIKKNRLFQEIDNGLSLSDFSKNKNMKKD